METANLNMTNREKLQDLLQDILLLDPSEFRFDLGREEVETWDSMSVVAIAVGVDETFGYHMSPDEAMRIAGVADIINVLEEKGVSFAE
jgi:acyl carrier protein